MILVTGATGNVGSELVRALSARGARGQALVRRDVPLPDGFQALRGDLNDSSSFIPVLDDVEAAFLLSGYRDMAKTVDGLKSAGARRIVLLSSSAAPSGDRSNAVAAYHIESEDIVRSSGIPFTFLQPNSFMSNTLQWASDVRAGTTVRAPFAEVGIATIDPFDIAAVAAEALTSSDHEGRSYRLSGPEVLRPADRMAILNEVLGTAVELVAQSDEEAEAEMRASMPGPYVDAFLDFFVAGTLDESHVLPTVQDVLGRAPRSFAQWVEAHRNAFAA